VSRRRQQSRLPGVVILVLAAIIAVLGLALWRIYPEYRNLRERAQRPPIQVPRAESEPAGEARPVVAQLYFSRVVDGKQRMVAISRELPPGLGVARSSLEELLRGEVPRGCDRPLPPGTRLLDIAVTNGTATVDLSGELQTGFRGGSDNEQVTVYSIVNTLTSLPTIDRVQILVEGMTVNTLGGHQDISGPLAFDSELVAPHA
jgi:spore germination protein GerM